MVLFKFIDLYERLKNSGLQNPSSNQWPGAPGGSLWHLLARPFKKHDRLLEKSLLFSLTSSTNPFKKRSRATKSSKVRGTLFWVMWRLKIVKYIRIAVNWCSMHVFKRSWRWAWWTSFSSLAFWISLSCSMASLHADACGSGILNYFSSAWEKSERVVLNSEALEKVNA